MKQRIAENQSLDFEQLPVVPKGWVWSVPSDFCSVVASGSTPTSDKMYAGVGEVPFIKVYNLTDCGVLDFSNKPTFVDRKTHLGPLGRSRAFPGDVLINIVGPPLGKVSIVPDDHPEWNINQAIVVFRPREAVLNKYLAFAFLTDSIMRRVTKLAKATAGQHNIGVSMCRNLLLVPVAPLNEQRRIVAKIEELFSNLDAGVVALERVKANLKRQRAAVLKAAVEGKLTNECSNQLFEKSGWSEIGTVLTCVEQGWSPKCEREPATSHTEWAVMKTSAVLPMQFLEDENKRLPASLSPEPELEVQPEDLLITRAGPRNRAAVTCLVRSCRPRLIVCDKVYRIRCDRSKVTPAYLEIVLNSPGIIDELDDLKTGISDSGVNLTQQRFRQLRIPLPPLSIQKRIVTAVEERLSQITAADQRIEASLLRAIRLRQSILKRAFEGNIVPQDPNDEPASVLLCRVSANGDLHLLGRPQRMRSKAGRAKK